MKRIPEAELMADADQAAAYAAADFESAHSRYPQLFAELFPDRPDHALVLDLGCGPGDVTRRFAKANPGYRFHAVDGSAAMLQHAPHHPRIQLQLGHLPHLQLPTQAYDVILASSVLHHLPDPQALWQTIRRYSQPGTLIFVVDLRRPRTRAAAAKLTNQYSAGEPAVLQRDFANSLLAAFTPSEVRHQLVAAHLAGLTVRSISDRHLAVYGSISQ